MASIIDNHLKQRIEEGYSLKLVFEELSKSGQVTMSYTAFCDYVRGTGQRVHGKKKVVAKPQKIKPAGKDEPFKIERVSLEELVHGKKEDRPENGKT